jgi:hypothetical protein
MLGSAMVGFLAGFLVWSYISLVICTTPFCDNRHVRDIGFGVKSFEEQHTQSYLIWWCNFVDKFVASGDEKNSTEQTVKALLIRPVETGVKDKTGRPAPITASEPNQPKSSDEEMFPDTHTIIPP